MKRFTPTEVFQKFQGYEVLTLPKRISLYPRLQTDECQIDWPVNGGKQQLEETENRTILRDYGPVPWKHALVQKKKGFRTKKATSSLSGKCIPFAFFSVRKVHVPLPLRLLLVPLRFSPSIPFRLIPSLLLQLTFCASSTHKQLLFFHS